MCVTELIANTILRVYVDLQEQRYYPKPTNRMNKRNRDLLNFLSKGYFGGITKNIILYHYEHADEWVIESIID